MFWRIITSGLLIVVLVISIVVYDTYNPNRVGQAAEKISRKNQKLDRIPRDIAATKATRSSSEELIADLKQARSQALAMKGYESRFVRQVQKDGELLDLEVMDLKLRHEPFSVSLHWPSNGKQVAYVDGQNKNMLIAKLDKGLLSLAGSVKLAADSEQAMRESRYPITEIGLVNLIDRILQTHEKIDVTKVVYERSEEEFHETECVCYTIHINSPDVHPEYSKTVLHICKKSKLPIRIASYDWKDNQPGELLEHYEYHDVKPVSKFEDSEFDPDHEK